MRDQITRAILHIELLAAKVGIRFLQICPIKQKTHTITFSHQLISSGAASPMPAPASRAHTPRP